MSPMIQTRLQRFRQNRLGFFCFILFSLIFAVSLAANLIANEKPLLVKYQQSFY
jgi:microcin C transport system permease protein